MITVSALDSRNAASSALPLLTVFFCASSAVRLVSPPKPPRITLKNERFIALHMMYDRIAPDEPTSDPAMISIALFSEKPMPAAADHRDCEQQVDQMLTGINDRRALEEPELVLARQLAERDHRTAKRNRTD